MPAAYVGLCINMQLFIEFTHCLSSLSLQLSFVFAEFPMVLFLNNFLNDYNHTLFKVTQCGKILFLALHADILGAKYDICKVLVLMSFCGGLTSLIHAE